MLVVASAVLTTSSAPAGEIADCNDNGIADDQDIAGGTSLDCNSNGTPDECEAGPFPGSLLTFLDFDGVNDYVRVPSSSGLRPANNFTIEGWVNVRSFGGGRALLQHDENGGGDDGYTLYVTADGRAAFGALNAGGFTVQSVQSTGTLILNQWHHLAGAYDNSVLRVYLDGQETSKPASGNVVYSVLSYVNIGRRGGTFMPGTGVMDGRISDVRFWNVVRTPAEIGDNRHRRLNGDEPGLEGYWKLDEGQGLTALDSAGAQDGTLTNGPTWVLLPGDCNTNGVIDACDVAEGTSQDCNANGSPDECDLIEGASQDCDGDETPDECQNDCNGNGLEDSCDLAAGTSQDCDSNEIPDECQSDCNGNGVEDACDLAAGTSQDCDSNGMPDECQEDCNGNGVLDECDLAAGTSQDSDGSGTPDECDRDCNGNGTSDGLDIAAGTSQDCNANSMPDECELGAPLGWSLYPTSVVQTLFHAMAYDSARGVVVQFGGRSAPSVSFPGGQPIVETREWNGDSWTVRSATGPSPRRSPAMAYDSARGVTVLFGGSGDALGETWEWNGALWTLRATSGPGPRSGHAMVYDDVRGVTVLFGGQGDDYLGDTWEWDGTAWTQRATSGPNPRRGHAMAYDGARGVTVLFGGVVNFSNFGDTWEWDGSAWTQRATTGPSPRNTHAMAYDAMRGVTVLFGGLESFVDVEDTWEWDGSAWTQRASSGPTKRSGHAMVYDSSRGQCLMFGGVWYLSWPTYVRRYFDDTWAWDGSSWTQTEPVLPAGGRAVYDSARRVFVLLYGAETWEFDGRAWARRATTGPSAHALAYDSARGVTVLFRGGAAGGQTWEWDGSTWTLRATSGPGSGQAMAYDSARGVSVLFGGAGGGAGGQTWEWDGSTWTLRATSGPGSIYPMAYDSARGVSVLFDGAAGQTWEWDGNVWVLRASEGPPYRRAGNGMAYDSERAVTVLFGGEEEDPLVASLGDTWTWDGNAWQRAVAAAAVNGPSGRHGHAMAYDSHQRMVLVFGGTSAGHEEADDEVVGNHETWRFALAPPDCNANNVPDECETLGPCTQIISARSWKTHGGVGPQSLGINTAGLVGLGNVTSEPRSGGIAEVRVAFYAPPGQPTTPVSIEQRTCGDGGAYVAYAGASTSSAAVAGQELILTFTPALENARTYRLTLGPEVTAAASRSIEVRGLVGDYDNSGQVNGIDRSGVVAVWTGPGYTPRSDIDLSGATNALDRSAVVAAWTGAQNCAP